MKESAYESSDLSGLCVYLVYFCGMEQPGVFLLSPLDGMLIHRRVIPSGTFCTELTNSNMFRRNKLIISKSQLFFSDSLLM